MARYRDSFEEFVGFSRRMDRMLNSLILYEQGELPAMWRPPTDVYETAESVVILVEIAGMNADDVQVEFSDKILRVSGRRADNHRRAAAHCLEVQYGEFASNVYVPGEYDVDAIEAEYKDGFLTITLPKVRTETKSMQITGIQSVGKKR